MDRAPCAGYALLAVLLIIVVAATFALAVAGAVHALLVVEAADADAGRATRLEAGAVGAAMSRLRWTPSEAAGRVTGEDAAVRGDWAAEWEPAPPLAYRGWPRRRMSISATAAAARRAGTATVELRAEEWAVGVSCEHDADISASCTVAGSGLYVGGCLRGREQVAFVPGDAGVTADGRPADGARGECCPVACAHAGAGIFADGVEVHDAAVSVFADDGDPHMGVEARSAWVAGPSPEFLCAAAARGTPPGDAYTEGTLDLEAVSLADASQAIAGRCLVLPRCDEVTIVGVQSPEAGRLLVVVPGDAVVGQPGERVELHGGLVVCGRLRVRGSLSLEGPLHAGSLVAAAPVSVAVPGDWRDRPLPGATKPVVVEIGP